MSHPVIHFEVTGKDGAALQEYYGDLFDWKMQPVADIGYALVDKVGDGIAGGIGDAQQGDKGYLTFYVQTDDPQATLDKAVELGGQVVQPVMDLPGMVTLALFADPEGNVVGLVGSETPPAA